MLDFRNLTPFTALTFGCSEMDGIVDDVVVAKAQYALTPASDAESGLTLDTAWMEGEERLCVSDDPFGEVNKTSVRRESDLAPYKPRCDVIVIGSAHTPTGSPIRTTIVGIEIAEKGETILAHRLTVHGARDVVRRDAVDRGAAAAVWLASLGSVQAPEWYLGEAKPFTSVPLRYELAFGGELKVYPDDEAAGRVDRRDRLPDAVRAAHPEGDAAPVAHSACPLNPVGRGFIQGWHAKATQATRYPAPQIEAASSPLTPPLIDALVRGRVACGSDPALHPQGFGVVAKSWQPRLKLAGTYDEAWRTQTWPYPPADFDMAFWNGAHPAMQCRHLRGGEIVTLLNLLPAGSPGVRRVRPDAATASFRLPALDMTLRLRNQAGGVLHAKMPIDTLTLDLEAMTIAMVWRALVPESLPFVDAALIAVGLAEAEPPAEGPSPPTRSPVRK